MRKSTLILALALAGVLLTGCTGGTPSNGSEQDNTPTGGMTEQSAPTEEAESTEQETPPEETGQGAPAEEAPDEQRPLELYAPNGDKIELSEITKIWSGDGEMLTPEQLTADNWYSIECEGFAYMAEPTLHYNSIEDPELYDEETWRFEGVPEYQKLDYRRYNTGDTYGSLTVSSATTSFTSQAADSWLSDEEYAAQVSDTARSEIYFNGCTVEFDGSIELTGWLALAPEDEGYTSRDDLLFVPDNEGCVLPSVLFSFSAEEGVVTPYYTMRTAGIGFVNEYPSYMTLGGANADAYSAFDLGRIPYADEGYAHVRITLTDINMRSVMSWIDNIDARVSGLEVIG